MNLFPDALIILVRAESAVRSVRELENIIFERLEDVRNYRKQNDVLSQPIMNVRYEKPL